MEIDRLEAVQLGDTTQWIRVRGADVSNPVLLLIQQGPGFPMINEARRFERLLGLERDFTVVYWDQRGCGRSLRKPNDRTDLNLERMVADTHALLELLRDRFDRTPFVAGFSLGATVGAYAAARRPDLVATLVDGRDGRRRRRRGRRRVRIRARHGAPSVATGGRFASSKPSGHLRTWSRNSSLPASTG